MGNSASTSSKYHPDAVGPTSPHWAPQSKFNQHESISSSSSSPSCPPSQRSPNIPNTNTNTSTNANSPARSPINRVPVPLYDQQDHSNQKDSRKSFSGPIRNRPSNPSNHPAYNPSPSPPSSRSRSITSPSSSTPTNSNHLQSGAFDQTDPAGSVPPFIPSKVSTQPKQPPIIELEDEARSIVESSDHGHSPHTLPVPLAQALKQGLGKSADELDRQFREQQAEAEARTRTGARTRTREGDQVETIQDEGDWMTQKGKKRETGETDRERLLAYWEQTEAASRRSSLKGLPSSSSSDTSDFTPQARPGIRRPRPHSWNSNQRPSSSQTIMSFATGDSSNNSAQGWTSDWQDTRGRDGANTPAQGYSSAYSYGAELSTPMEEEEEWQTPAERPDLDRFSFSQDGDQMADSDTEVNRGRFTPQPSPSATAQSKSLIIPSIQPPSSNLLALPQQSKNPSDQLDSSRKHSKASLLSAAAASSTADPELDVEQEDSRSSHDRRRRSLLAGLGEGMNVDKDQEMHDQQVGDAAEEEMERDEEKDRMEVEDAVGLALGGPPETNHQWPNQPNPRASYSETMGGSNSLRSSRISNRTNMSSESNALHAAVETLRKGPSPMVDRRAIDELFEGQKSRDTMEGIIDSNGREETKPQIQSQPPVSPVKRNRAASLMDRLRGRTRKGSEASNLNPNSVTPSSTSQEWGSSTALNSPSSPSIPYQKQSQDSPRSVSSSSFFNSRMNRPRAHSAAQSLNRSPFPFSTSSSSNSPSQERRESDAMAVDQDGVSEGVSETTAKPQRQISVTRRALLRRKPSHSKLKKNPTNQTSTFVVSSSTPSATSPNSRTLAHKRSATGSITNASARSHSARSVRSKRSSGSSLRSAYRRETANLSDSSNGPAQMKRTPSKSEDPNGNQNLKVSPPSLSLRRKGSPMPIRNSYLSEQRRPLPLPASASAPPANTAPTSSSNQVDVERETPTIPSKKVKPKLVRIGLGRRTGEASNAEVGGVWEDVESLDPNGIRKTDETISSAMEASPLQSATNNTRRWSGGWSWSKKSPTTPVFELPNVSNEVSEIRAISPLAHIESHGVGASHSNSNQQGNDPQNGASSSYRSPSSSFSSLAPPPTPALPPPPRRSNRRRTDSSSASLVETSSSAQQSPSEASFANLAMSSRKGSLPDSLPSHEQKRFSNGSNSNENRNSVASSSSSPRDRTASPSSPKQELSPNLAPVVSGLAAFAPASPAALKRFSLDGAFEETAQAKPKSRGNSGTVSDAGTQEYLLSENDEELRRACESVDSDIEAQAFPQLMTPKASPSQGQRRSRNGLPIPPPALSPVKEASIHKTPSFASEIANDLSQERPSLPHTISPSSSTVDLKKYSTAVGPAPNSPPPVSSPSIHINNHYNPNSLAAQKSSSSFQKHSGEDVSFSSSSPSASLRQLLSMHPQSRVRKPSQAESDVSLMSANGKVLDSVSLASAPTNSTSPGRRLGSRHSHSRSSSGGTHTGGAEDRLSHLLVESNQAESSSAFGNEFHSLPRTPRRPLPSIPDHAPIQTRGSRSFSLPSGKAPVVPTSAELRSWKEVGDEDENDQETRSNEEKALQSRRSEPHRALKNLNNSSKSNHGSSLASELGLQESNSARQRTFSAPTAPRNEIKSQSTPSTQEGHEGQNENQSPVPFADSGVQASLAALAALEASRGDEEEDPRAAWARERILGIKGGSTSVISRLSVLNDTTSSRRSASEEISGSEIELRGSRDRRRVSPYSKSRRRDANRSSDGGYSSSTRGDGEGRRRKTKSGFSNQSGFLHQKDFTGMATASSASLAEFEASQEEESEGTAAIRSRRFKKRNSRSIPPSFLVSPPMPSQEQMQVDEGNRSSLRDTNDWDEQIVPALRKRIEQEKQFELEQIQNSGHGQHAINMESFNHRASSSNLSSNVSPTLVSSSVYNPLSMSSSVESRTTGVPFPRESFSNSSPKTSRLLPSESSRSKGRRSFDHFSNRTSGEGEEYHHRHHAEDRRRRRSETSKSHHQQHHAHSHQSSPKQTRPKTSERKQVSSSEKYDKYASITSSNFRSRSNSTSRNSPNQTFSHLSSTPRSNSRNLPSVHHHHHHHHQSSPKRSVSHEVSSSVNRTPTASLNMSVRTGVNAAPSSSKSRSKKPSKQGFTGEDILAWQSSISSGYVG